MNIAKLRTPGMLSELCVDVVSVLLLLLSVPYTSCFRGLAHFTCRNKGEHRRGFFPDVKLRWYTQIPCQLNPCQTMQRITFRDMAAHWVTFRYIIYVPWHYMTLLDHDITSHVIGSHYTHTWSYVHARMQKTLFNIYNYSLSSLDV